jgi:hypothetical protein
MFVLLGRKGRPEPDTPYLAGRGPAVEGEGKFARDGDIEDDGEDGARVAPVIPAVRDADTSVSDSESRDNLPVIQNGSGKSSTPTEEDPASRDGNKVIPVTSEAGNSGHKVTESAPEAGSNT